MTITNEKTALNGNKTTKQGCNVMFVTLLSLCKIAEGVPVVCAANKPPLIIRTFAHPKSLFLLPFLVLIARPLRRDFFICHPFPPCSLMRFPLQPTPCHEQYVSGSSPGSGELASPRLLGKEGCNI
ncbi:hypothetical protein [Aeromonas bivalvium]|uniref:hypothetical protein n=1 Tax=Aeromonas bivalvium TaxID=440079 RepID=UPI0038CFC29D